MLDFVWLGDVEPRLQDLVRKYCVANVSWRTSTDSLFTKTWGQSWRPGSKLPLHNSHCRPHLVHSYLFARTMTTIKIRLIIRPETVYEEASFHKTEASLHLPRNQGPSDLITNSLTSIWRSSWSRRLCGMGWFPTSTYCLSQEIQEKIPDALTKTLVS